MTKETAEWLDLPFIEGEKYALVWMTPTPILPSTKEDATAMAYESELAMWQMENLLRGVDGYSTEKYLEGIAGARQREELLKGRNGTAPISVDRNPNQRPGPAER